MTKVSAFAPAKVNLTLHVTGRRADGYHLLDSLVVFAGIGDQISVREAQGLHLRVQGPNGGDVPAGADNLVMRAARLLSATRGAEIVLDKHLPVASGIGGGSTDAAATMRALAELWGHPLPDLREVVALGADIPVCLSPRARRMQGIGDFLHDVPKLPALHMVLVNPREAVSTPQVFRALARKDNAAMTSLPAGLELTGFIDWLGDQRNDLEAPARAVLPSIDAVLSALREVPNCLLARMSGSGATCFGLFREAEGADQAAQLLRRAQPGWWVAHGPVL